MKKNSSLIKKNKELFNHSSNNEKIILVEYNNFHGSHLCQALLANYFKLKNRAKIVGYFNYCLITSPLRLNFFQKLRWKISSLFLLGFKKIYNSFGVENFIRPHITQKINLQAQSKANKFLKKRNLDNNDVVNFKINNIWIGDLIYDTYLKSRLIPTFDVKDQDFQIFFKEFLELFFYWQDYLKINKVSQIIGVHACYSYGLPIRIGINMGIPSYVINTRAVMKINKKIPTMYGDFKFFKKDFSKMKKKFKQNALEIAKKNLNLRIAGKSGAKVGLVNRSKSSFLKFKKNNRPVLNKNSKIKILICTHDFLDSIHVNGKNFFPDFYLWISFLGKISNDRRSDYEFYVKNHPLFGNKYERYQEYTEKFVNQLIKKFPNIKKIPNSTSHHQIITEGIDYVLTIYGSVAIEYAYLGIPVINATQNHPHINYNFNINPKNLNDYKKIINNLKKIKLDIKKKEIYECYFMKHSFYDENWLFDRYEKFTREIGGYQNVHTEKLYEYWLKHIDSKFIKKTFDRFNNFQNSNFNRLNIFHSKKVKNIVK